MRMRRTPKKRVRGPTNLRAKVGMIDVVRKNVVGVFTTETAAGGMARKLIFAERAGRRR